MATPLTLSMARHGAMITMACMQTDEPLVHPYTRQVSDTLLVEIGEELASITTIAHHRAALGSHRTVRYTAPAPPRSDEAWERLKRLGEMLFTQCFPVEIQQRLRNAVPTQLLLRLSDQLVHVPWELAFDGNDFLLSKFRIGRQVETAHDFPPPLPVPTSRLRVLIIADPSENLTAAQHEGEHLSDLLETYDHLDVTLLGGKQWRKLDLLAKLNEYDIVHYAGHAYFDAAEPSRSGWVLHDDVLTAAELRSLTRPPLLVFSNACQAGVSTPWQHDSTYEGRAFGIGSAFLLAGVRNYIGTFCVIHDAHSAAFAATFYQHLFHDANIGDSLAAARQQVRQDGTADDLLWASYMHYGNPAWRIHGLQAAPLRMASAALNLPPLPEPPAGPEHEHRGATPPRTRWNWLSQHRVVLFISLFCGVLATFLWLFMAAEDTWVTPPVTLALVPFEEHFIVPRLSQALLDSHKIKLVEREKLQHLLTERRLDPRDIDQDTAIAMGKLLAARVMAFGTWRGSPQAGMLSLRLVDVEQGAILMADTKPFETAAELANIPAELAHTVLQTLSQEYPRQGRILNIASEQRILLNIGKDQGVTPGLTMAVFVDDAEGLMQRLWRRLSGPIEPPATTAIGHIQILQVDQQRSHARLLQSTQPLEPGWLVQEQRQPLDQRHSQASSRARECHDGA